MRRILPGREQIAAREIVLDRFIECWDGLDDPRTDNAGLHDFHEILAVAMCAVLCGGQGSVDMGLFAKRKSHSCEGFSSSRMACPAMTRSAGFSAGSIRSGSGRRFSGSWRAFRSNAKVLWR
jgi:DDE_Tnp_1-associated